MCDTKWYLVSKIDGIQKIIESNIRPKTYYEGGEYTSISGTYDTEAQLVEGQKIMDCDCKECAGKISLTSHDAEVMADRQLCFKCNIWTDRLKPNDRTVIVDGTMYARDNWSNGESSHLGYGGRVFYIQMNNGEKHKTNSLWCSGDIPEWFKDRLPDNAAFLSKTEFSKE